MPRIAGTTRTEINAAEQTLAADNTLEVSLEGKAAILGGPQLDVVEGPDALRHAEELAFMEEKVTILVHESTDPNADNPVEVGVNGRKQFIFRGHPQEVRRCYVERLARAKRTSFRQDTTSSDPTVLNKLHQATALQYPFSLIEDKNPRGGPWLAKVLGENSGRK
jgi:hypothetical protein